MTKKLRVDEPLCIGCRICEVVCSVKRFGVVNPSKSAIRVIRRSLGFSVKVCVQCEDAPCVDACPSGALKIDKGWIEVDYGACTLCLSCVEACPLGAIFRHPDVKHVIICNACQGRFECIPRCPTKAIIWQES